MNILSKTESPLLSRAELKAEISFEKATPKKEEIKKQVAAQLKAPENLIVIKSIKTIYGTRTANILAYIYKDENSLKKIEPKIKEKKAKPGAEKPAEGEAKEKKPAGEKKEEKPAEMSETKKVSEHTQKSKISDEKEKPKEEKPAEKPAEKEVKEKPKEEKKPEGK